LPSHTWHNIELNKNMRAIISPKKCEKKESKYSVWLLRQDT